MAATEGIYLRGNRRFEERLDKAVRWQTKVLGCQVDEHWLQVGSNEYLPMQVSGHKVIIPAEQADEDEGADEAENGTQRRSWADLSEEPGARKEPQQPERHRERGKRQQRGRGHGQRQEKNGAPRAP